MLLIVSTFSIIFSLLIILVVPIMMNLLFIFVTIVENENKKLKYIRISKVLDDICFFSNILTQGKITGCRG